MAKKDVFGKLPSRLQTDVNKKFFDATFEQAMSEADKESINGFIGRREGGSYDPLKDFYVPEPTKDRTWNQLEPIALSIDKNGIGSNEVFTQDILNYIENNGGIVGNQDRLFNSERYSFSPPIDVDKFINYAAYLWKNDFYEVDPVTGEVVDDLSIKIYGIDDNFIEGNILKEKQFTTDQGFDFTNDIIVTFPDSESYSEMHQVIGVGSETGIEIRLRYSNKNNGKVRNADKTENNPDYTTMDFGARNNNDWSANNFWFHKETLSTMAAQNNKNVSEGSLQARRPIISFDKDMELFGYATEAPRDISYATIDDPLTIVGRDANDIIRPNGNSSAQNNNSILQEDDTLIFLGINNDLKYDIKESFVARQTPYDFPVSIPFADDKENIFSVVRRNISLPLVYFVELSTGQNFTSFNESFSESYRLITDVAIPGDPNSVDNTILATKITDTKYVVSATAVIGSANTRLADENIFVFDVFDADGVVRQSSYTTSKTVNGDITIDLNESPNTYLKAEIHVVLGTNDIINPDWFEISPETNDITYRVAVPNNIEEELTLTQQSNALKYKATLSDITDPEYVRVYVDGDLINETEYNWKYTISSQSITVSFLAAVNGTVTAKVQDGILGLLDGQIIQERSRDIVDTYVNADVQILSQQVDGSLQYTFATGIPNVSEENLISVKLTDKNNENVDAYNIIIESVLYVGEDVVVSLSSIPENLDDILTLYFTRENEYVFNPSNYVWRAAVKNTNNLEVVPNYERQWKLLPFEDITDFAIQGDSVIIKNSNYENNKSFYFDARQWTEENLTLGSDAPINIRIRENTFPKFQLYYTEFADDNKPVNLSYSEVFPQSTFGGSEIFSYKLDNNSGLQDPYLGKNLTYRNINQSSELVFEHDLEEEIFTYVDQGQIKDIKGYYYFRKSNSNREVIFDHTWARSEEITKLRVIDRLVYVEDRFELQPNEFIESLLELRIPLSVAPNQIAFSTYDVLGFRQGRALGQGRKVSSDDILADITWDFYYEEDDKEIVYYVKNGSIEDLDVFEFKTFTNDILSEEDNGYYETPSQLEDNPDNREINDVTMGDLLPHFSSIISNQKGFSGNSLGARNNYRDTEKDVGRGDKILQTSAPLLKAMLSTTDDVIDIPKAIEFSSEEYTRYKDKIVSSARNMIREGWTPTAFFQDVTLIEQQFDEVITRVYNSLDYNGAFVGGNMLPWGTSSVSETLKVDSSFTNEVSISNTLTEEKTMCLVYFVSELGTAQENSRLLIINQDYTLESSSLKIINQDLIGEDIRIKVYENIESAKVPSTPSKCGMYETYKPEIILDTTYANPNWVIVGHDGSKTPCYTSNENFCISNTGEDSIDLRDKMLLEFETRIYNNISVEFNNKFNNIINQYQYISGKSREAKYTSKEFRDIIIGDFLEWNYYSDSNYQINENVDNNDWKTWNYSLPNPELSGNWKGIYIDLYDTVTPNTTPWSMLGFTIEPEWWVSEYGSPTNVTYTFDCSSFSSIDSNVLAYGSSSVNMWRDIANGRIIQGERAGVYSEFARPHMFNGAELILPVGEDGKLIAPHLIGTDIIEPSDEEKSFPWKFGDLAPVEYSWYKSSSYAFSLTSKIFIMSPNNFCELLWDRNGTVQAEISPNQIVDAETLKRVSNFDLKVHNQDGIPKTGYQRFVYDRMKFLGSDVLSNFTNIINGSKVKLAHRVAGYTNSDNLKVLLEGSSYDSTNSNLVIPTENYEVKIHTGEVVESHRYSGVMIRISELGYQVFGYDRTVPEFRMYGRLSGGKTRQINVGGKPAPFRNFKTNVTYSVGSYVLYNNVFYQSKVDQNVVAFEEGSWTKLAELPSTGGTEISYNKEFDVRKEFIVDYNTIFSDAQSLFDFLIGYGDWLEADGWKFNNIDNSNGKIQDWKTVAEDVLFWITNEWNVGATLQVSAGSEKLNLSFGRGYPTNINNSNGEYGNILSVNNTPFSSSNVFVHREGQDISVSSLQPTEGIFFLAADSNETEHIIVFDNTTEFNDRIFDPLLGIRVERLGIRAYRTKGWYGKYEADGYILNGDKLAPNFDNLVESSRYYYDPSVILDNQNIEDAARHLIGFENRDYLTRLRMFDDIQYQLYKGMLPEKGTFSPLDAISRAETVSGSGDVNAYETWAFKLGELGDVLNSRSIELSIDGDETKSNPQLVELDYPSGPINTGEVRRFYLINCEHVYQGVPVVKLWSGKLDASVDSEGNNIIFKVYDDAIVDVVLDEENRISSLSVASQSGTFTAEPSVHFYDIGSNEPYFTDRFPVDGLTFADKIDAFKEETVDSAITIISNRIDANEELNDAIKIDIDDSERWLSTNNVQNGEDLLPATTITQNNITKECGYVHLEDIDITSFYIDNIFEEIEIFDNDLNEKSIWVADTKNIVDGKDWNVYTLLDVDLEDNDLEGRIIIDNDFYTYEPSNATTISEILSVTDVDGNKLVNGLNITPVPYDSSKYRLFPLDTDSTIDPEEGIVYLDQGESNGLPLFYTSARADIKGFGNSRIRVTANLSQLDGSEFLPSGRFEGLEENPELSIRVQQIPSGSTSFTNATSDIFAVVGKDKNYVFEAEIAEEAEGVQFIISPPKNKPSQKSVFIVNDFQVTGVEIVSTEPNGDIISEEKTFDIDISSTNNLFFVNSRFDNDTVKNNQSTFSKLPRYWLDSINSKSEWGVYEKKQNGTFARTRKEEKYVDNKLVKNLSVYDGLTNRTLAKLPNYDPYKGIIPNIADRNLTYINDIDPSRYTVSDDSSLQNNSLAFSKDNVGELWWDTSTAKYILYEQGDNNYRLDNWGKLFPKSKVDVYEWVESSTKPSAYVGKGTPKSIDQYVVRDAYNYKTETYVEKYYFWVIDKTDVPPNIASRNISAKSVANIILNPRVQGYQWFSFVSQTSFIFDNINEFISQGQNIFQISFTKTDSEIKKNIEWKLVAEGKPDEKIPEALWIKMIDSISKYDESGNFVPSPKISDYNKLGIENTPRQTIFDDVFEARRVLVDSINVILKGIRIRDDIKWIDDQVIVENNYWSWTDWYAEGYDASNTEPKIVVNYEQITGRVIPPPPEIEDSQDKILLDGDIIQVYVADNSAYYVYDKASKTANFLVRRESTALFMNENTKQKIISKETDMAIRYFLILVGEEVFVDNSIGENKKYKPELFFTMTKYAAFEQKNVDWFFKTTYLDIVQENKQLLSQPKFYNADELDGYLEYIQEVKPYQTKIREFSTRYDNFIDDASIVANDFDSLAYTTTPLEFDSQGNIIGGGKTIPVDNPVFNPFDVLRSIKTRSVYDSVQCSFTNKSIMVETGGQEKTVGTKSKIITFGVTPFNFDVYVNGLIVEESEYTKTSNESGILTLEFNNDLSVDDYVFVREYIIADGNNTDYEFKTMPQVSKITYSSVETGLLGDEIESTTTLIMGEDYEVFENDTYLHWTNIKINSDAVPPNGAKLYPEGYVKFTHTDIEEMRLSYKAYQSQIDTVEGNTAILDLKLVNYDLLLDVNGLPRSGWGFGFWKGFDWGSKALATNPPTLQPEASGWNAKGTQPWNSFKWNFANTGQGNTGVPNDLRVGKFIMYTGAANRFINSQEPTILANIKGDISSQGINYSQYSELFGNVSVTPEEQQTLDAFRANYADAFKCSFQGGIIDAKDFIFQNTVKWDEFPWGDKAWNQDINMPFITVDNGEYYNTAFSPNGSTSTFTIDRLIEITSVILNGGAADEGTYIITQDYNSGSTSVSFNSDLSSTDRLELVYEKNARAYIEESNGVTTQFMLPYRAYVTGVFIDNNEIFLGGGYSVDLMPTTTEVDISPAAPFNSEVKIRHKRIYDANLIGNGDTYLVKESDFIAEVSIDGTLTDDYVATTVGRDMQIILGTPAVGIIVKITYSKIDDVFSNDTSLQTIDGGDFLPSNVDAGVTDEMAVFKTSDGIVINYTDRSNTVSQSNCRIFINEVGNQTFHSLYVNGASGNKINLSVPFKQGDNSITITDASAFPQATLSEPSVIWIGSERMTYSGKSGNTLSGIRRMTQGTSIDINGNVQNNISEVYPIGSRVYPDLVIPFLPDVVIPSPPNI